MDKDEFVYSVNGLRVAKGTGKTLYRWGTDVGQKQSASKKDAFCTLAPVDMQAFFHSRHDFQAISASKEVPGRAVRG